MDKLHALPCRKSRPTTSDTTPKTNEGAISELFYPLRAFQRLLANLAQQGGDEVETLDVSDILGVLIGKAEEEAAEQFDNIQEGSHE